MKFTRSNFSGGMNLQFEPTRLADNEYPLLVNGRNREGTIRPIAKPKLIPATPGGTYQGLFGANDLLMLVAGGIPYVANLNMPNVTFARLGVVSLNAAADTVWGELVPKSTLNNARVLEQDDKNGAVSLRGAIPQSAASVILQDGQSPPLIIDYTGAARLANTYDQWTMSNREYVPTGRNMLYADGILYIVSPDGREIYRSIKGRPLDFMINVAATTGDKMTTEAEGGASTMSHAVGYDVITCLAELNSSDNPIFVGTNRYAVKVVPDSTNPIFGQPRFINTTLMPTGPNNQLAFLESNGDNLFVNTRGIRSFNAALQMRNRGDNAPFSRKVASLFKGLVQSATACAKFDDYCLFAVSTIYGSAVLVYDETLGVFTGLDMYAGVGTIKQFARVTLNNADRLFFITTDNQLYEAFAGTGYETTSMYLGEFCSQDADVEFQPGWLKIVVVNPQTAGTLTVTPYVDRRAHDAHEKPIEQGVAPTLLQTVPFNPGIEGAGVQHFSIDLNRCAVGWKFGVLIQLSGYAEISHIALTTQDDTSINPPKQEAQDWSA